MMLRTLFDTQSSTFTYLLADETTRDAVLIDPVREHVERDLALIGELGLTLRWVVETHVHADHVTGADAIRKRTGARTVSGKRGAACADVHASHGERLPFGRYALLTLETPGHTDDSVSFHVNADGSDHVFTGDALLVRGTGRADFQNGDPDALYRSLTETLFALPDETTVHPGHDYRGFSTTTIGEEKRFNPRVAGKTREEFVAIMRALQLPAPGKLDEAVPANRRCGATAPA